MFRLVLTSYLYALNFVTLFSLFFISNLPSFSINKLFIIICSKSIFTSLTLIQTYMERVASWLHFSWPITALHLSFWKPEDPSRLASSLAYKRQHLFSSPLSLIKGNFPTQILIKNPNINTNTKFTHNYKWINCTYIMHSKPHCTGLLTNQTN